MKKIWITGAITVCTLLSIVLISNTVQPNKCKKTKRVPTTTPASPAARSAITTGFFLVDACSIL